MNIENFKIYWQSLDKDNEKYQFLKLPDKKSKLEAMRRYVNVDEDSFLRINCLVKLTINSSKQIKLPLI